MSNPCRHGAVDLVVLPSGEVVRGICEDCEQEVSVETREDGRVWIWRGPAWHEVTAEQVELERIEL